MKRAALILVAVLLLGPFSAMVPADVGMSSGLAVFMTWPDEEYDIGSQLDVTIHVYMEGDPFDPDTIYLIVGYVDREMNVARSDTGKYASSFIIEEDMLGWGALYLTATAEVDAMPRSDEVKARGYLHVPADPFEVSFLMTGFGDSNPLPGETIELEVTIENVTGRPIDDVVVWDVPEGWTVEPAVRTIPGPELDADFAVL